MEFGPVQILVVGFTDDEFAADVLPELRRLREGDYIRVIGLDFMTKDEAGDLTRLELADLTAEESERLGALVGSLIGPRAFGEESISIGAGAGWVGPTPRRTLLNRGRSRMRSRPGCPRRSF